MSADAARFGQAVDLAYGFANGWTHDLPLDAVEEWARQLRDELNEVLHPEERET